MSSMNTDVSSCNKELLLRGTLQHWKALDVSQYFYAWYKYSQNKRYIRDMHDYLIEKKCTYLKHTVFLKWNRKLYCLQASKEFQVSTVIF